MAGDRRPASNGTGGIHGTWLAHHLQSPAVEAVPGAVGFRVPERSFQTLPSFSWSCFLLSGLPGDMGSVTPNPCFLEARRVTLFGERIFAEVIS